MTLKKKKKKKHGINKIVEPTKPTIFIKKEEHERVDDGDKNTTPQRYPEKYKNNKMHSVF